MRLSLGAYILGDTAPQISFLSDSKKSQNDHKICGRMLGIVYDVPKGFGEKKDNFISDFIDECFRRHTSLLNNPQKKLIFSTTKCLLVHVIAVA